MIFKNKKSQIGATLTWVFALLIVIFIMAIFVLGSMALAKVKGAREPGAILASSTIFSVYEQAIIQQKLADFVNSKNENGGSRYEILSKADEGDSANSKEKDRIASFSEQAKDFLEANFPAKSFSAGFSLQTKALKSETSGYVPQTEARYMRSAPVQVSIDWNKPLLAYSPDNSVILTAGKTSLPFNKMYFLVEIPIYPNKKLSFSVAKIK